MKRPELLSPAGNMEKFKAALLYGANAVYIAGKDFGMRKAADNFTIEEIREACDLAHLQGKKVYLTVNITPRTDEYPALKDFLRAVKDTGVDAYIVADPGVLSVAKSISPDTDIHISTQTGVVSAEDCRFWAAAGAKRCVLARELSLEQIRDITREVGDVIEIETFVHGSMCVSFSGRCLLSMFYTGRDANHGECSQPCRWNFNRTFISEEKRPDDKLEIIRTEAGSFIMSSKDMCMIEHIPELINSGISSLKIEGRMKSAYYTAVVTNTYKMAMDRYFSCPENYSFDPQWQKELESVSHREYSTGFFFDDPLSNPQLCSDPGYIKEKAYLAVVEGYADGRAYLSQRNKASDGETAEIITPGECGKKIVLEDMRNEKGEKIESSPHPYMKFSIKTPFPVRPGDIIRAV